VNPPPPEASPTALSVLRAVAGGAGSLAPVHAALGTVLDTIEPGLAVARVPRLPPHRLRGPGVVPVLGDLVLSAAITSSLAAGLRISTLTLHTAMLGPLPPPGAALVARAELVAPAGAAADGVAGAVAGASVCASAGGLGGASAGASEGGLAGAVAGATAVSRAAVYAADGRPVAQVGARCAVLPSTGGGELFHDPVDPDPFAALGPELRAAATLANSAGGVQGGVLAAVVGHRIAEAIGAPDAAACDCDVTFVRGVAADGAGMAVDVEVRHGGRRLVAADARLRDSRGRVAVIASAACWLPPESPNP
jgi:acyl-coenzyme A thioesterase PaaI-like protein